MIRNAGFNTECLQERSVLSSLDPSVLELVDFYWAQFFGCVPEALRADTPQIVASTGPGAYAGCYLMEFGGAPVVSLPVAQLESSLAEIGQWHAGIVRFPALVEALFGERVAARVGPAFVGYADLKHFRPVFLSTTR